jgi:MSHA biogenesis protein MshN
VRQTLVALLLEAKRVDEAAAVLQDGLALDPSNTGFAMLLARALVERNDVGGALALLQKHAPTAQTNAEYHAFAGALYQRLERHGDAISEYQAALKLAPNAGVWWIGMGISQQALNRPKQAVAAFQRAKDSGNLAPGLIVFTDSRLKLLK